MNPAAERHLAKAEGYLGKGKEFHQKAADEIIAAQKADPALGYREIGARLGYSKDWCQRLVTWRTSVSARDTPPFAYDSEDRPLRATRQTLREAPLEQVEQIIGELPPERQQAIAAAAGSGYHQARRDFEEKERNLTPAERKEREAGRATIDQYAGRISAPFTTLDIAGHLEQAREKLSELIEAHALSAEVMKPIDKANEEWQSEYEVASAMAGKETA